MKYKVIFSHELIKNLLKLQSHIRKKLAFWAEQIQLKGMSAVRKVPGYHDEPLKGKRKGQRSVRLSKGYRAIYTEEQNKNLILIKILEVTNHEY